MNERDYTSMQLSRNGCSTAEVKCGLARLQGIDTENNLV